MAELGDGKEAGELEQLWARRLAPSEFELCCIPFFLYGYALGDVVEAGAKDEKAWVVKGLRRRSGRATYRLWFGEKKTDHRKLLWALEDNGALIEHSSTNLVAVDAHSSLVAQAVEAILTPLHDKGELMYEIGVDPRKPDLAPPASKAHNLS